VSVCLSLGPSQVGVQLVGGHMLTGQMLTGHMLTGQLLTGQMLTPLSKKCGHMLTRFDFLIIFLLFIYTYTYPQNVISQHCHVCQNVNIIRSLEKLGTIDV